MTTPHKLSRCWINQPQKNQPFHQYHGVNGLAFLEKDGPTCIFRIAKPDLGLSLSVPKELLKHGWNHDRRLFGAKPATAP